jgi:regulation of enolase protein 1 (concanavalin A-like superfamily)
MSMPPEDPRTVDPRRPDPSDASAWLNPPVHVEQTGDGLLVTAAEGSDLWRTTSYGFTHDTGAVVTRGVSDWSVAPVPDWAGREVTVRASRSGDALTVRARAAGSPWRLVRVAPLDVDAEVLAGPFCCAPTRAGLRVRFTSVAVTAADASLHPG